MTSEGEAMSRTRTRRGTGTETGVVALLMALMALACSHKGANGDGGMSAGACLSDKDCRAQGKLCDPASAACVQCLVATDCGMNADCVSGACVAFATCQSSLGCGAGQVCDTTRGRCVGCLTSTDCGALSVCVGSECRASCVSDKDCVPMQKLCDFGSGTCVTCVRSTDCPTGKTCSAGACTDAVCTAKATSCAASMLFTCADDGTAWGSPITCPVECRMTASGATCAAASDGAAGSGGAGGSGGGSGDGGAGGDGSGGAGGSGAGGAGGAIVNGPCGDTIDDMEDGDGYICRGNGRIGQWYTVGSAYVVPAPTLHPIPAASVSPARDGSTWAIELTAPMYYGGGAILGVDLQYDGATSYGRFDASEYQGISFWARGPGVDYGIDVWVACAATTPIQYGGTCPYTICYDNYVHVGMGADWSQFMIPFSILSGGISPFNRAELTHIQFRIALSSIGGSPPGPIELWVDDLAFYR